MYIYVCVDLDQYTLLYIAYNNVYINRHRCQECL